MTRLPGRTAAALLVAGALALSACGDDAEEAPPAADPGGSTFALAADPSGSLAYERTEAAVDAGPVTIEFTNESDVVHDVVIETGSGEPVAMTERVKGGVATAKARLQPGSYSFYCSVTGHRSLGMEGTLTAG